MRPMLAAAIVLVLAAALPAGGPALAEGAEAARREVLRFPDGSQVRVVRGPATSRRAEASAPAAPSPARAVVAVGGRTLWLLEDGDLTACFVQKTSYVNGYRLRCARR